MRKLDVEQGTEEWFEARKGKITATRAAGLLKRTTRGWAASREQMIKKIAMERLDAERRASATSRTMERGHDLEPDAIANYEMERGVDVERVGLILHATYDQFACSPDGLVGKDGGLEIKSPDAPDKQVDYLLKGSHLEEYEGQLLHSLYVTGRKWWDIVGYDPRPPAGLNLAIRRMSALTDWSSYEAELLEVDRLINDMVARLQQVRLETAKAAA